ncbi:hypothetical protein GCM10020220_063510 [Nonomuraea rubra]
MIRRLAPTAPEVLPRAVAITTGPARLAWEQTGLPLLARTPARTVIHAPYYSIPLRSRLPNRS